ncbi:hypothetical protein ACN38_g8998 [Penicillium nordicum]|uniref:Uncharacterized protein n=1 Tax=Penicillium nordicum TaxID=229535 RepID=A0A0M8P2T0_9EURO|nr:hypothetical protein ACN38_g8998 [Penicillium nordicum]
MVAEPQTGNISFILLRTYRRGFGWSFQSFQLLLPHHPRGFCSQLSTFHRDMGVYNHSKPCDWLENQRLSELEHICARCKLDLTSDT